MTSVVIFFKVVRGEIYFFIIFSSKCCKSLNCVTNSLSSYNFCVLCSVWTLFSSLSWDLPALVCHPVDKMGTFTLIPRAYGIVHLRQTVTWHYVCLITVLLQHLCVCSWWSFMKWRRGFIQGRLSMLTNSYWLDNNRDFIHLVLWDELVGGLITP